MIKYYSATYACENCEKESGYAHIYSLAAPPRLLKHSLASASTVADVMTKKYVDGLPLYRQEKIWAREGVDLSRATMANWVIQAAAFLKGFSGCLVTDGYAGYNQVTDAVRCGCWAHMRRKWREAMPKGATTATSKAAVGYEYCNKLFALEKKFSKMSDSVRKTARQVKAEPLLEAYWRWLKTLAPAPGSKLAEAVTYALNQKPYLSAFLEHGEVDISNNFAENAIRPFTLGRKNWLFSDTTKGAESSAIIYTLVETAKVNGLDPQEYLLLLLKQAPFLGRNPSQDDLDLLLPWRPAVQAACISSNHEISGEDL